MSSLREVLAAMPFDDNELTDGDIAVEAAVVIRMVDAETGDSYLFFTSSTGANTYSLRGMLDEAASIERAVTREPTGGFEDE